MNAFALGLVRRDQIFYAKAAGEGNPVIYVGSKTGRDGIHGATMASEEFSEESEAKRPNVQVGDPFLEKLLLEACLEAMQTGAIVGIQDMGAAGPDLLHLRDGRARRRGPGNRARPGAAARNRHDCLRDHAERIAGAHAAGGRKRPRRGSLSRLRKVGTRRRRPSAASSPSRRMRVLEHGKVVAEIPNQALTDDAPLYNRPLERWEPPVPREMPEHVQAGREDRSHRRSQATAGQPEYLLEALGLSSSTTRMVQTNTVEGPGGDAGVIRIKGTQRGLAMALDGNGRWCYLDPKLGAMHAVAESARNVACTGATPIGGTNCLNFGNPEKPHIMWQFSQTIDGITKACEELETPITGGNVSFYNETLGRRNLSHAGDGHRRRPRRCAQGRAVRTSSEPGARYGAAARLGAGRRFRCRSRVWLVGVRQGNSGRSLGFSAGAGTGEGSRAAEGALSR